MLQKLNTRRGGFTLVEIMIVVAIIALLAAIAVPNFLRARKRSQATRVLEDLRMIDSAIDQYAIETNKVTGNPVVWNDIRAYLKTGSALYNSGAKTSSTTPSAPSPSTRSRACPPRRRPLWPTSLRRSSGRPSSSFHGRQSTQ